MIEMIYPVGSTMIFDIGVAKIAHDIVSSNHMRYRILTGARCGETDEQPIQIDPIADGQFAVSWQERDGHCVVSLEDFNDHTFRAYITTPENQMIRCSGAINFVEQ